MDRNIHFGRAHRWRFSKRSAGLVSRSHLDSRYGDGGMVTNPGTLGLNKAMIGDKWRRLLGIVVISALLGPVSLLSAPDTEAAPLSQPVPGSGLIAFVSYRPGNHEIYTVNADGTSLRRLTDNSAMDLDPDVSGDGRKVVFSSDREHVGWGNAWEIYTINADGTGDLARLTSNDTADTEPAFSPDGQRIAFVRGADIYTMTADGNSMNQLTDNTAWETGPVFSPDGQKIAFTRTVDGNVDIYTMNARDGSDVRRLTEDPAEDRDPDFSPDGQKIAFASHRDGPYQIYTMNANDGTDEDVLATTTSNDVDPSYSPDGGKIAFTRDWPDDIYVMNADGTGETTNVTNNPARDFSPSGGGPRVAACTPGSEQVTIYELPRYQGHCVVKGIGTYNEPALFAPVPNDSASSIRVGANVEAVLARETNLTGGTETFIADDDDFNNNSAIGNDTMSSFRIQPRTKCDGHPATIIGTDGNDMLIGTDGTDVIVAGRGDDEIQGAEGPDTYGSDIICAGDGNDLIVGGLGTDRIFGEDGDDTIEGYVGDDVIIGGAGDDSLSGHQGNDQLNGEIGNDDLNGGSGEDICDGGLGANVFHECEEIPLVNLIDSQDLKGIINWAEKRSLATINAEVAALDPARRDRLAEIIIYTNAVGQDRDRLLRLMKEILSHPELGFYMEIWAYTRIDLQKGRDTHGGTCNRVYLVPDPFWASEPNVQRNTLLHESLHSFNCVNGGPQGSLDEGSAIWIFKNAFPGEFDPAETWAEATYGTKLYYRDREHWPDYPLEAPRDPSPKLVELYERLSNADSSHLPWNSTEQLQYCYKSYFEQLTWTVDVDREGWLRAVREATAKMVANPECRPR